MRRPNQKVANNKHALFAILSFFHFCQKKRKTRHPVATSFYVCLAEYWQVASGVYVYFALGKTCTFSVFLECVVFWGKRRKERYRKN